MQCMRAVLVLALVSAVAADLYMHNPPGSNDRNRERSDNRNNGNRMFDSQNNGQGGYAWRGNPRLSGRPDPLTYYSGSLLRIEWTNQHSCGPNPNIVCDLIVQYGCDTIADNLVTATRSKARAFPGLRDGYPTGTEEASDNDNPGYTRRRFSEEAGQVQDGTNTIPEDKFPGDAAKTEQFYTLGNLGGVEFGMHEHWEQYQACGKTQRNKGLYLADQKLNQDSAKATRQNPNGGRRGLECPEERDYYPYWNNKINKWTDVAVLTNDLAKCDYFRQNTPNNVAYGYCEGATRNGQPMLQPLNEVNCTGYGGTWNLGVPNGNDGTAPLDCRLHPYSRDNHLGNAADVDASGTPVADDMQPETAHYIWRIPSDMENKRCVVRLRYNMSTLDYPSDSYAYLNDPYTIGINASRNCERVTVTDSADVDNLRQTVTPGVCDNLLTTTDRPLFNRPYVDVFTGQPQLSIALNTHQSGRTFQDRSYVFDVLPSPAPEATIWNLNTRGRRGNIVQCYPAVEYDFVPSKLKVSTGDLIHIQFHGSDFNAAKNANNGEGWQYSDRFNIVEMEKAAHNFPRHHTSASLFPRDANGGETEAIRWALVGQIPAECKKYKNGDNNEQNAIDNCGKLNRAPNRFPPNPRDGLLRVGTQIAVGTPDLGGRTYNYVCTRNNNFSNRSQKAQLIVNSGSGLTAGQIAGITVGVFAAAGLVVGGLCFYGKRNPKTRVGGAYSDCQSKMSNCRGYSHEPVSGTTGGTTGATAAPDMEYRRH